MSQMTSGDSNGREAKIGKAKQNKLDLYYQNIFFLKETKAIPFPTNSEIKDFLQVDFVAFFASCFIFLYGFLEN